MSTDPIEILHVDGARTALAVVTAMRANDYGQVLELVAPLRDEALASMVITFGRWVECLLAIVSELTEADPDDVLQGFALDLEAQIAGLA